MGKLILRLTRLRQRADEHDRILGQLRRRKARLTGSRVEGRGAAVTEIYEFTTTGLPTPKPRRLSPVWISPRDAQHRRLQGLVAATAVGLAIAGRRFTRKEGTVAGTQKVRSLALGKHASEARRIYELARRLVQGEGPPEELRMADPPVTVRPHTTRAPSKDAWGVCGIGVGLEMQRPYPPVEAMVVAGYILCGIDWPTRYRTLKLPASLDTAYWALEAHFAPKDAPGLVTIPKAQLPERRKRTSKALDDKRESRALPAPQRPQLVDHSSK